jgi:phosphomevalonate kinase
LILISNRFYIFEQDGIFMSRKKSIVVTPFSYTKIHLPPSRPSIPSKPILTPNTRDADLKINHNPFVETALCYALSYVTTVSGNPIIAPAEITILADNDYYSTPSDLSTTTNRFHNFGVPLSKAHKTGLGSSAALVTSLTAAVLTHYLPTKTFNLSTPESKRRLHNLAQAAHCAAQGKVGSGFDVASAVFGSCLYRRFSPSILATHSEPGSPGFASHLRATVDEASESWDTEVVKDAVKVPSGLRLVMCDVSCGSGTPGMVRNVLDWRKREPAEAERVWKDLQAANESLAREMRALAEIPADAATPRDYAPLRACFKSIRKNIRAMGEKSGVPIEPPAQTKLLDACEGVEGVVGGTVPGAGGYDAIALLIEDKQATVDGLLGLFKGWEFKGEVEGGGKVSMLGVREEMEGVRVEDFKAYEAFVQG